MRLFACLFFIQDGIYKIKKSFNTAFDAIYQSKLSEVNRIKEKNIRIRKILSDLDLSDDDIFEPGISVEECLEQLLEVKDKEVPFDRFITKEEQEKLEEEKIREEGRVL